MFCALLGQDIRGAFTGPMVLWFCLFATFVFAQNLQHALILFKIVLVIALLVYLKCSYFPDRPFKNL